MLITQETTETTLGWNKEILDNVLYVGVVYKLFLKTNNKRPLHSCNETEAPTRAEAVTWETDSDQTPPGSVTIGPGSPSSK